MLNIYRFHKFKIQIHSGGAKVVSVTDYYPARGRVILHVDMNAFYCSVHAAEEPTLYAGKPTAVSGSLEQRKGIIVTASYEARARGVRTGMNVREGMKRCPDLIVIKPDFHLYRAYSSRIMSIAYDFSPLVETVSIDECYIDITGSKQFGTPIEIATQIQQRVREELSLPCSIGIAPNKLLAKMGSDMKKPNGISIVRRRDVPRLFWDQPCDALFGIGKKTAEKLAKLGIYTIGQLASADERWLVDQFGTAGSGMKKAAHGIDESPVNARKEANKSIGHTTTLPQDITESNAIRKIFLKLSDQVARRLRKQQLLANTVQITIRDPNMKTITRACTLETPTDEMHIVSDYAWRLFQRHWIEEKPVRLLGVSLHNLQEKKGAAIQLDLFDYEQIPKKEQLTKVMDKLRDKFGENAVLTAGMIGKEMQKTQREDE